MLQYLTEIDITYQFISMHVLVRYSNHFSFQARIFLLKIKQGNYYVTSDHVKDDIRLMHTMPLLINN